MLFHLLLEVLLTVISFVSYTAKQYNISNQYTNNRFLVKKSEVLLKIIYLSASISLLKRKLAIGIYIKVVAQILPVHLSGQRALNSIPTRRYGHYLDN